MKELNKIPKIIISVVIVIGLLSCNSYPKEVEHALDLAGNNRDELVKVINHYKNLGDKEKLKAAFYLIENSIIHFSYYGKQVEKRKELFDFSERLAQQYKGLSKDAIGYILYDKTDSLLKEFKKVKEKPKVKYDVQSLTAEFLIENIDYAFLAWRNAPWYKDVDFKTFKEYILPYRVGNEDLVSYRKYLYENFSSLVQEINYNSGELQHISFKGYKIYYKNQVFRDSMDKAFDSLSERLSEKYYWFRKADLMAELYPYSMNLFDFMKCKYGDCKKQTEFIVGFLRVLGLPVALEKTHGTHYFASLIKKSNEREFYTITKDSIPSCGFNCRIVENYIGNSFDNQNGPIFLNSLVYGISFNHTGIIAESDNEFSKQHYVSYFRAIPKAFQVKFSVDKNSLLLNADKSDIPKEFRRFNVSDVTSKYYKLCEINVALNKSDIKNKRVYLCFFNPKGWVPVSYAKVKRNKANFNDITYGNYYFPMSYSNGEFIPVAAPFICKTVGEAIKYKPDTSKK